MKRRRHHSFLSYAIFSAQYKKMAAGTFAHKKVRSQEVKFCNLQPSKQNVVSTGKTYCENSANTFLVLYGLCKNRMVSVVATVKSTAAIFFPKEDRSSKQNEGSGYHNFSRLGPGFM